LVAAEPPGDPIQASSSGLELTEEPAFASLLRSDTRMRNHLPGVGRDVEVDEDLFSGPGVVTDKDWRGVGGNQLTPVMLFMLSV